MEITYQMILDVDTATIVLVLFAQNRQAKDIESMRKGLDFHIESQVKVMASIFGMVMTGMRSMIEVAMDTEKKEKEKSTDDQ